MRFARGDVRDRTSFQLQFDPKPTFHSGLSNWPTLDAVAALLV
jgi:hypothetical protein